MQPISIVLKRAESKLPHYENGLMAESLNTALSIKDYRHISAAERSSLLNMVGVNNFVLFSVEPDFFVDASQSIRLLMRELGFKSLDANLCSDEDSVSRISVDQKEAIKETYIPYTDKELSWHTDGYYNAWHQRVQAFLLLCENPAEQGGENELYDPDILFWLLHDSNPALVEALMQPQVMCIPENRQDGELLRPQTCTPVFEVLPDGALNMRFSARKRNILWQADDNTRAAVEMIGQLLQADSVYCLTHKLLPGQGYLSNNILHRRRAFSDGEQPRVIYRARFYERVPKPE